MDCGGVFIKYVLFIFNILFVICGIQLIVTGLLMPKYMGNFSSFSDTINTDTISILIITLGCIVSIVAFFGCCGSIRESICCTTIYAIFMLILFALQIALVVWFFEIRYDFYHTVSDVVDQAWENNDSANGYPMNKLQITFKCCGRINSADYTSIGAQVPNSCCGSMTAACPEIEYISKPGCRQQFADLWAFNIIIRYVGIGVALVELLAFTFACCLASSIRKSGSIRKY